MSNLPGKITDPHLSAEEPLTFRRCLRFILQALAAGLRLRSHHQNYRNFISFLFSKSPCRIRAILCAAAIFTCILTGKSKPSSSKGDTSAEK